MAHKKGGGSSRNGRDSNAQRRGVKVYAGTAVAASSAPSTAIMRLSSSRVARTHAAHTIDTSSRWSPNGSMSVESDAFADSARMPAVHELLAKFGVEWPSSPLNLSILLALVASVFVWWFLWKSRAGYVLRAVGSNPTAAHYAGIRPRWQVLAAMGLSGALAGLVGVNEIAGVQGKLTLDFVAGAGFTGIAVALMGRNHPVGIILASLLFGTLYQGGVEVSFEVPGFSREMVVTVQGLFVLFAGAMAMVSAPMFAKLYAMVARQRVAGGKSNG